MRVLQRLHGDQLAIVRSLLGKPQRHSGGIQRGREEHLAKVAFAALKAILRPYRDKSRLAWKLSPPFPTACTIFWIEFRLVGRFTLSSSSPNYSSTPSLPPTHSPTDGTSPTTDCSISSSGRFSDPWPLLHARSSSRRHSSPFQ